MRKEHRQQLQDSAIPSEFIEELESIGALHSADIGLTFKYFALDGTLNGFFRIRLDEPMGSQKYTQEPKTGGHLYMPPQESLQQSRVPLMIVEGEKKALSALARMSPGVAVVGIGGVWNWVKKGTRELIHEFEKLEIKGRTVVLAFDSDTSTKPQCGEAEAALAKSLRHAGAEVRILQLPMGRKGLDDWFLFWGEAWREYLGELWLSAMAHRSAVDMTSVYEQVYDLGQMLEADFPMPRFFAGNEDFGLVAEGLIMIIHGSSNLGKTYLSTQLAFSIANGEPFLGHECPGGASVLMLQGELPPGLFARGRLAPVKRFCAAKDIEFPERAIKFLNWSFDFAASSRYKEAFTSDSWQGMEELDKLLDKYRPAVLVIDPLQSYNNLVESSNDQIRELLKRLKRKAIVRNMGIVLVDHDRKDSSKDGADSLRGASNKVDLVDTVLGLELSKEGGLTMRYDKVRYITRAKPAARELHREMYHDGESHTPSPFFAAEGSI